MRRLATPIILMLLPLGLEAQTLLKPLALGRWHVPPANYSGLAAFAPDSFAVVDDKSAADGFHLWHIVQDARTGRVLRVAASPLKSDPDAGPSRAQFDAEAIAWHPAAQRFYIASEHEAQVYEYLPDGRRTGRRLAMPQSLVRSNMTPNGGFESLCFDARRQWLWLTTEQPLLSDGGAGGTQLRLYAFGAGLQPVAMFRYPLSPAQLKPAPTHIHGVSDILALPDGRLLVMEREASVPKGRLGARCRIRLFVVNPDDTQPDGLLVKTELLHFDTHLKPFKLNFANYEGLALGRRLDDGRQTVLLLSDSQGGAGNRLYHLRDYLRVLIL